VRDRDLVGAYRTEHRIPITKRVDSSVLLALVAAILLPITTLLLLPLRLTALGSAVVAPSRSRMLAIWRVEVALRWSRLRRSHPATILLELGV